VLNYSDDPVRQALTVGLATLIGGAAGALLGTDATSAALAARNESLNNVTSRYQSVKDPRFQANVKALGECVDPVACRSNASFLEAQVGSLSDAKIASMCGGNADCVSARQQERSLYQQAYGQALAHQDANVAARDYLGRLSQTQGNSYTATQLDAALQRYQLGTSDSSNSVDAFVAKAIIGNVALFGAIRGVTGADSDGGGSSRRPATNTASERAGSIRNVNPGFPQTGRTQNCVNCSIATDATLAGNPATALPSVGPQPITVLERQYGGRFGSATTADSIAGQLATAGDGSRGIVFGSRGPGETGHVFNVVNQNGTVRFLDGQTGKPADLSGYVNFHLLRTN
jgi:hypothetical protein